MSIPNPTAKFAIVSLWVLDSEISDRAIRLINVLQSYLSGRDGQAFPSRATLGERLRCSKASIDRALRELESLGAVCPIDRYRPTDNGRTSNEYKLHFDAPCPHQGVGGCSRVSTPLITGEEAPHHPRGPMNKTHSTRPKEPDPIKKSPTSKRSDSQQTFDDEPVMGEIIDPHTIDCERLGNLLADLVADNGNKRPNVTRAWVASISRMIRLDGHSPQQVENAMRWAQSHDFWSMNVRSPDKLRSKWDRLRSEAEFEQRKKKSNVRGNAGLSTIERLWQEEQLKEKA